MSARDRDDRRRHSGGYITYAGAHRLLTRACRASRHPRHCAHPCRACSSRHRCARCCSLRSSASSPPGRTLIRPDPAASAFSSAAGNSSRRLFGLILWAAAITSVIGASYTSVTFMTRDGVRDERRRRVLTIAFIVCSTLVYLVLGSAPVSLLVFTGAFNGLILPIGMESCYGLAGRDGLLHGSVSAGAGRVRRVGLGRGCLSGVGIACEVTGAAGLVQGEAKPCRSCSCTCLDFPDGRVSELKPGFRRLTRGRRGAGQATAPRYTKLYGSVI